MKNRPEIFQNERVSASAGAGKTYALTKRFIALASTDLKWVSHRQTALTGTNTVYRT